MSLCYTDNAISTYVDDDDDDHGRDKGGFELWHIAALVVGSSLLIIVLAVVLVFLRYGRIGTCCWAKGAASGAQKGAPANGDATGAHENAQAIELTISAPEYPGL